MKKINKVVNKEKYIFIILLIAISVFTSYPYMNRLNIWGHDLSFHINRIDGIVEGLKNGNFPVIINSGILDNMGYGSALFYPEIFLYIPAILSIIGFSIIGSYKLFILGITMATFISMYYCIKSIFKSNKIAIMSSVLYTMSLYRLEDVFIRAALGEILAFIFLPIILLGMYEIILRNEKKWYILVIGMVGLANSHMISLALVVIIIAIVCILNIKKLLKNKKRIMYLAIATLVSICICICNFLPMLEQLSSANYSISEGKTFYSLYDNASSITKLFETTLHYGFAGNTDMTNENIMNLGIGIILLILPLLLFIVKNKNKDNNYKFIVFLFVFGYICVWMTSKLFPWQLFSFMSFIQFPFRINMFATFALSIVSAYAIYNITELKKEATILTVIIMIIITAFQLENITSPGISYTYDKLLGESPIGAGEYLPIGFESSDKLTDIDKNIEYEYVKTNNKIEFSYTDNNRSESGKFIVPLTYYKGYIAYIQDGDIITYLDVDISDTGTVLVDNSSQKYGNIIVEYKTTKIQIISYCISIISFATFLIYLVIIKVKSKKQKIDNKQ